MSGKGGGKAFTGGSGNGPVGKPKLHGTNPGPSGHPIKGKGTKLTGPAD